MSQQEWNIPSPQSIDQLHRLVSSAQLSFAGEKYKSASRIPGLRVLGLHAENNEQTLLGSAGLQRLAFIAGIAEATAGEEINRLEELPPESGIDRARLSPGSQATIRRLMDLWGNLIDLERAPIIDKETTALVPWLPEGETAQALGATFEAHLGLLLGEFDTAVSRLEEDYDRLIIQPSRYIAPGSLRINESSPTIRIADAKYDWLSGRECRQLGSAAGKTLGVIETLAQTHTQLVKLVIEDPKRIDKYLIQVDDPRRAIANAQFCLQALQYVLQDPRYQPEGRKDEQQKMRLVEKLFFSDLEEMMLIKMASKLPAVLESWYQVRDQADIAHQTIEGVLDRYTVGNPQALIQKVVMLFMKKILTVRPGSLKETLVCFVKSFPQ